MMPTKMMRRSAGIKPGGVHIPAFMADSSAISAATYTNVIARHSRPKDGVASARLRPGDPVFQGRQ
jgi:hypothetical protein